MKKLIFSLLCFMNISAVFETENNWQILRTSAVAHALQSFAFDRHGSDLYSISEKPTHDKPISEKVEIFDTATGIPVCDFKQQGVNQVAFSPKDKNIVAVTSNKEVALWDINKIVRVAQLLIKDDSRQIALNSLAFDRVGELIAAGCCGQSKNMFLFDPRVFHAVRAAPTRSQLYGVTFLNNENRIIESVGSDSFAHITHWDLRFDMATSVRVEDNFLNVSYAQGCDTSYLLKQRCNSATGNGTLNIVNTALFRHALETVKVDGVEVLSDFGDIAFNSRANMILYKGENGSGQDLIYLLEKSEHDISCD